MKIEAVIFDLDGVIVSTDQLHYKAWKYMADKNDIYFDEEINNRLRGVSRMDSLDIILEKSKKNYSKEEKDLLAKLKNDYYIDSLNTLSPSDVLPGSLLLLEYLKEHNIKVAIGSSSKNAKTILKQIKLLNRFDAISDGTNIIESKPDPEVFIKAAEMLNILPTNILVVEDAVAGIEAAKNANMIAVAIHDATTSKLADFKISNLKEVIHILNI